METKSDVVVIGAGIFGLSTAIVLAENGLSVTVVEKEFDVMLKASLVNQNRIHYGYHYPRSIQTGKEALNGLDSFKEYFGKSIFSGFSKYYAIASEGSHLNASQFQEFCAELGIPLTEQWPDKNFLNPKGIENCWLVNEPVFDYHTLRREVLEFVKKLKGIRIIRNDSISKIEASASGFFMTLESNLKLESAYLINASYANLNHLLSLLDKPMYNAKFELLVLPVLSYDKHYPPVGVTIMDGPFCSLVPRGFVAGDYILSHVKHSVVDSAYGHSIPKWHPLDGNIELEIARHASEYYPILKDMQLKESWITTKMILPDQDDDDARPTMVLTHAANVFSIFSGKISTCIIAANEILDLIKK